MIAMTRRLGLASAVGFVLTAALLPNGASAASKNLYVGSCRGASPYTTIQSAVNAVNDDHFTINVCPGTYNETVLVEGKEDLTIRNVVVKNQAAPLIDAGGNSLYDGIDVIDSEDIDIRGLRVTNASVGIFVFNSPETEVRNTFISNSDIGIFFVDGSNKGLAQQNTVINGTSGGIGAQFTSGVTIKQNTVNNVNDGVGVFGSDKTTVDSNSLTNGGGTGVIMISASRATIRKNTTNFFAAGIVLVDSTNNMLSDGTAKGNSDVGLGVTSDSTNNTLKKNFLQGNGTDAIDESSGGKTAGTANSWSGNKCDTSLPVSLCGKPATSSVNQYLRMQAPHRWWVRR